MKIGTIGAGAVAKAIARSALAEGHTVVLSNSSGGDRLGRIAEELGDGASTVSRLDLADLDLVLLAVPWRNIATALAGYDWTGHILVDATNPFIEVRPKLVLDDLKGVGASEIVSRLAPGARLVKAFNSITMGNFEAGPKVGPGKRVLFVSGDDALAKATVRDLITSFGFAAIDLGDLVRGGRMQQAGGPLAGRDLFVSE